MATELMTENSFSRFQDDIGADIVPAVFGIYPVAMDFMFRSTLRGATPLPAWFSDFKWSMESHCFPKT